MYVFRRRYSDVIQLRIDNSIYEDYLIYAKKSEMFQLKKLSEFHQYIRDNPELYHPAGYVKLINLGFYKKNLWLSLLW